MQYCKVSNGILGSITSLGVLEPGSKLNLRSHGLLGGSWELSTIIGLCFFSLIILEKNKKKIFYYLIATCIILFLSKTRATFVAFFLSLFVLIFFNKDFLSNFRLSKIIYLLLVFISFLVLVYYLVLTFFPSILVSPEKVLILVYNFFVHDDFPTIHSLRFYETEYWSLIYRFKLWNSIIEQNFINNLTFYIGSGFTHIYTDSLIIRMLYNFGAFGTIFIFFLLNRVPVYIIIYFLISGATLDLFISMKIFLFTIILFMSYKINGNNSR